MADEADDGYTDKVIEELNKLSSTPGDLRPGLEWALRRFIPQRDILVDTYPASGPARLGESNVFLIWVCGEIYRELDRHNSKGYSEISSVPELLPT